jgi:succinate dehydrogenase / fumarate reductase flavoprotein subunit
MELSTRDLVARSIHTEVKEGRGSEHGGAYLDISHQPAEYVKRKLPSMYHQFLELADVDITKGPMEVGPTCHYMMGGLRVDAETAATNVPGLYAAGEAAAGLHGANRLGGNSLSDLVVFGRRAGLGASQHAGRVPEPRLDDDQVEQAAREMLAPFERPAGESPYDIHRDLQELMHDYVGIFRSARDLQHALGELEKLRERAERVRVEGSRLFNPGWHLARDLRSLLIVAEAVSRSAQARQESRGAHSRLDYPNFDEYWARHNNVIARDGETMRLTATPLPEIPDDLKKILAEE